MNARPRTLSSSPPRAPELLDSDNETFSVFAWHNVTIVIWIRQATDVAVNRLDKVSELKISAFPQGFSNIHVVKNGAEMPTPEARAGFVHMMEKYSKELACVATVLLGTGFWMSALQSIITGMRMLSPRSFDHRVNSSFEAVASWLPKAHEKRTGVRIDPQGLLAALDKAYAEAIEAPVEGLVKGA